ncbi:ChaC-like protein [Coprinellus micaceus]|uniref:glutathione-specific gamma-glutamylcyclotransferase n=1 Tax=Coprinellus micaceus TaxID=71717 RepID=A0A4Y7T5J0_COPMI|nr:ChaC-like protein [Coprinellus micaceus]
MAIDTEAFIVFGYGSLIFKPPPHVIKKTPGFLKGYVRRFAQKSHDHRGTPEAPGRVVTLVHKEDWDKFSQLDAFPDDDTVWGVAYTIDPAYVAEVREYLDYREKDGYTMESLDIYGHDEHGKDIVLIHKAYVRFHLRLTVTLDVTITPPSFGSEPLPQLSETDLAQCWSIWPEQRIPIPSRQTPSVSYLQTPRTRILFSLEALVKQKDDQASNQ